MHDRLVRVVLAPDKFKGTATASDVTGALERGMRRVRPELDIKALAVADGGEGTVAAAVAAGFNEVDIVASGPVGAPVSAHYARRGTVAIIELAQICGLPMLPGGQLDPLSSSSFGLGEAILDAVDDGCRTIVLGLGGSASIDGGVGMLQALGVKVCDRRGLPLSRGAAGLGEVAEVDLAGSRLADLDVELVVAADVSAPLFGPDGAAHLFAPQKGATPEVVEELDRGLRQWALVAGSAIGSDLAAVDGAGAAGGVGFAAMLLGSRVVPGVDYLLGLAGFDEVARGAALVVTGEGSLDEQSLTGKVPVGVARAALRLGVPTVAVVGRCAVNAERSAAAGITRVYSLTDLAGNAEEAMRRTFSLLEEAGEHIATTLPS